jgi:uncharacterized protein YggE
MTWTLRWAVLGSLLVGLTVSTARTWAQEEEGDVEDQPSIVVSGTGRLSAAPDQADISVGVVTQDATAKGALDLNTQAMTRLISELKERGVAAKDIQTANINVSPQYSQPPQRPQGGEFVPRIVAYQVTNTVTVTARDLKKLGELLDAVVTAGANQMYGINFRIAEPEKLLDQARKAAVADARRKAELFAGEAGVVLGRPLRIRESDGAAPPMPMFKGRAMAMAAAAPVPVEAGEQELSVTIQVEYAIQAAK